jgi:hypothetical protein
LFAGGAAVADDHWFEIQRRRGGFRARPIRGAGWIALFLCIAAPLAISLTLGPVVGRIHPLLSALVLLVSLAISLGLFFTLVRKKGRWRD